MYFHYFMKQFKQNDDGFQFAIRESIVNLKKKSIHAIKSLIKQAVKVPTEIVIKYKVRNETQCFNRFVSIVNTN